MSYPYIDLSPFVSQELDTLNGGGAINFHLPTVNIEAVVSQHSMHTGSAATLGGFIPTDDIEAATLWMPFSA
jgi:hypothetical protein